MTILKRSGVFLIMTILLMAGFELGERLAIPGAHSLIPAAHAVVGRPVTPVSVAGVARRTSRRN